MMLADIELLIMNSLVMRGRMFSDLNYDELTTTVAFFQPRDI